MTFKRYEWNLADVQTCWRNWIRVVLHGFCRTSPTDAMAPIFSHALLVPCRSSTSSTAGRGLSYLAMIECSSIVKYAPSNVLHNQRLWQPRQAADVYGTLAPNDSRNDNACYPNMRDWIMDGAEKPTELVARSCHFRPWYLVCHFPVCHFPSLPIIRECNCTQRHVKTYSWLSTAEKQ